MPRGSLTSFGEVDMGAAYSAAEVAFLRALDNYKRRRQRPCPTPAEVLGVLHGLGYARPGGPASAEDLARALDRHRRKARKRFLQWSEVLGLLRGMGYAAPAADARAA